VDIIGGHIYGGGLSDYPLAREKGKEVWMTEHFTDDHHSADEWPLALGVATEIHRCMEANYSAYIWWYVRRFYGLIGENGNITKRGYVMSQFSKFIRPGYRRVDVSAYKTDSTIVIVAVNRNPGPAEIDLVVAFSLPFWMPRALPPLPLLRVMPAKYQMSLPLQTQVKIRHCMMTTMELKQQPWMAAVATILMETS